MSNVVIYDPNDITVPNRVINYLMSVNTPDYEELPNTVINPDLSGLVNNPLYWKLSGGSIIDMNQDEKLKIDDIVNAKTIRDKNYCVDIYDSKGNLQSKTWYSIDKGQGVYEGKVEESIYEYLESILLSKTTTTYYFDGSEFEKVIETYYSDGEVKRIIKKS
jgi:hypothetical protein